MGKKSVKNTTPTINDHEEMFLAKIAGENIEMPEVTNHKEIWLKRIAENSGGSDVIINPTLAGTEANATGIEVDEVKYKISEVKANPTLAGTEANLTSVEVDGTKYKVPEAKKLYYHLIETKQESSGGEARFGFGNLISSRQTPYSTISQIAEDLSFNTSKVYPFPCGGVYGTSSASESKVYRFIFEYYNNAWIIHLYSTGSGETRISDIDNDTVTEI